MITDEEHVYVEAARHFWRVEGRELTSLAKGIGALLALWGLGVGAVHLVALLPASHPKPTHYGPVKPAKLPVYKPAVLSADVSTDSIALSVTPQNVTVGTPVTYSISWSGPCFAAGPPEPLCTGEPGIDITIGSVFICETDSSCTSAAAPLGDDTVTATATLGTLSATTTLVVNGAPDPVSAAAPIPVAVATAPSISPGTCHRWGKALVCS